jgi:ABC-type antimicrobial peptide transport system permease subunit
MKKTTTFKRLTFLGFLFIVKPVFSQNNSNSGVPDSLISLELNEVIFTGKKIKSNVFNSAESISILNSKSLSLKSQRNTPELLNEIPGVFIQKTNHGGGSAFLRGLTGNQVLYLMDGIRINNAITRYGPNQYLNTIDRFSIDRMEIVRGSGSVLFGSDAIGGVINILSINPDIKQQKAFSGKISTRLGSNNLEESLNGRISYKNKESWLTSGITTRSFGDLIGGKNTKLQHPSGYDEFCYDIKTNIQMNKRHSVQGLLQYVHQKDVPVYHKYVLENFALNKMSVFTDGISSILAFVSFAGFIIGGFSMLVGGFGIANIMFVSVKERTNIIGIKKALGAKQIYILLEFLLEAIILCLLGGLIGLVLMFSLIKSLEWYLVTYQESTFVFYITFKNIMIGFVLSFIIGVISGFIPAWQASRMKPVDAIRG